MRQCRQCSNEYLTLSLQNAELYKWQDKSTDSAEKEVGEYKAF